MKRLILIGICCLLVACQNNGPLAFSIIKKGQSSGFKQKQTTIISSTNEWSQTWNTAHQNSFPKPPLPSINFDTHSIILIALGERSSTTKLPTIESITFADHKLKIQYKKETPDLRAGMAFSQPYFLVQVKQIQHN